MRISYVNGRYEQHAHAMVHIEDRGYQFSDGIYEYIAFYNGVLLDGDLHIDRLERSLAALEIDMPVTRAAMEIIIDELLDRNSRDDGGLYIQVTRGVARRDHAFPRHVRPALVMTVCAPKLPKPQEVSQGIKVISFPDRRWARRDIKSVSLLANILAKQQAVRSHTREAWLVDEDIVTEGSASNTYIVSGGEVVTHPANEFILGGITRDVLLQLARADGIAVAERPFTLEEAKAADEAFLTSTSANVLPVVKIDDTLVGNGRPGAVTRRLHALYAEHIFQQTGKELR